jgi:hypothetical protein
MAPPLFFLSKALAFGGFSVLAEGHRARGGISPCPVDPIERPSDPAPFLSRLPLNPDSRRDPGLGSFTVQHHVTAVALARSRGTPSWTTPRYGDLA